MIRKAEARDIGQIEESYEEHLRHEQEHGAYTVWKAGVYPTRATAEAALAAGTLYVCEEEGDILASIIADHAQPEEYRQIDWLYPAEPEQVLVIHLLCVRPSKAGRGIGREMVRYVIARAKQLHCKAVRLDTGAQNTPAATLYTRLGFRLAGTSAMAIGGLIAHSGHLFFEMAVDG
ncbi:GNAT family N-acetyltransferase [Dysosmobacter sp.]|uniref:GNAT family N-acetyltransferase n=1 Tax=Dysosmobacter sp. TaxID=2591382 RepID=UPI002A85486A|nr:GNAT family N-acetyltransferase [Dysosmobacter sp.]MDY3282690.1 GNAT family N-acetyltransferase [Dysosmobacter sp.]